MKNLKTQPIKVLTFDLDDTLWPLKPTLDHAEKETYNWLLTHAPLITQQYSLQQINDFRKKTHTENASFKNNLTALRISTYQMLATQCGYTPQQAQTIASNAFKNFINLRQQVNYFSDTETTLKHLAKHFIIGAITNGNADIYAMSIGKFFNFSLSAEAANSSKPEKKIFELAHQRAAHILDQQLETAQILHIGDDIQIDIQGAQRAGFKAVWFNPSHPAQQNNKVTDKKNAYISIQNISELTKLDFSIL